MPTFLHHNEFLACRHGVPENNGAHCPACQQERMTDFRRSVPSAFSLPPFHRVVHTSVTPSWLDEGKGIEEGDRANGLWLPEVK